MSSPWRADVERRSNPDLRAPGKRLYFEPLESRILLSAEIGVPPNDPLLEELARDRYSALEARNVHTEQNAALAVKQKLQSAVIAALEPELQKPGKPTPEFPHALVLPPAVMLQTVSDDPRQWVFDRDRIEWLHPESGGDAAFAALEAAVDSPQGSYAHRYGATDFVADRPDKAAIGAPGDTIALQALIPPPVVNGTVEGTDRDDTFENSDNDNAFAGLAGNDIYLFGEDWGIDEVLENAGEGDDTLDFSAVTADLTFNINADGSIGVSDGSNVVTIAGDVENLIGGQGDDRFVFENGAILAGTISGGRGNDTLDYGSNDTGVAVDLGAGTADGTGGIADIENVIGGTGDDTITGDEGDNLIVGGLGVNILDGGAGIDTVSYEDADAVTGATVDLGAAGAQNTGGAGIDTLSGFENLIGSGGDDTLTGNVQDNVITGGAGDDVLSGGGGSDTVSYADATGAVTVDLTDPAAQATGVGNDTLSGFENIIGSSGGFADVLTGTAGDNWFFVAAGADVTINGAGGNDSVIINGRGLALTGASAGAATFDSAPDPTTVTYNDVESVRIDNSSTALSAADVGALSSGLQALADRMAELESIAAYANAVPLADPLGASFGDLQDFGRVMQRLVDEFNAAFGTPVGDGSFVFAGSTTAGVTAFLRDWSEDLRLLAQQPGTPDDVRGTVSWIARTLGVSEQILLAADGDVAEVRFVQELASDRRSEMDLNLSATLRDVSITVDRETQFDFLSGFELGLSFGLSGLDTGSSEFFVDDSLALTASAGLARATPAELIADARIGFMGGSIDGTLTELNAAADAVLQASGGRWTLAELQAQNPFDVVNETASIVANLPFDTGAGFAAGVEDVGDGLIDFTGGNFLIQPLTVSLPGASGDFTLISPNELLRMLDQLGGWLTGLAQSEVLDLNVPFAGNTTIGDLLDFGEAFGEEVQRFLVDHDGFRLTGALQDGGATPAGAAFSFSLVVDTDTGEETYDVTVDAGNLDADGLRAAIETAAANAIGDPVISSQIEVFLEGDRIGFRPTADADGVTAVSLPVIGNESLGFDGERFVVPTSVLDSGVLGHDLSFTLNVDGEALDFSVERDPGNTSLDDLIADINTALAGQLSGVTVALDAGSTRELAFDVADGASFNGADVGGVLLIDVAEPAVLIDGLFSLGVETAAFASAQALAGELSEILSGIVGGVTVNFDVANSEMSFTVELARTFDIAALPIDVSVDLGEFIELDSNADLDVSADVGLQFTFGVDLEPTQSLVVAPPVAVPDLPDNGRLAQDASFNFTLLQQNFLASERLSGATLDVGDWTVTANGAPVSASWSAPASGRLVDANGERLPDHHFFIELTDNDGNVSFVDGVLSSFDTENNTGIAELAGDLETAMTLALAARGFDGLQVTISNASETGFDIGASGAGFDAYQLRLVTEDEFAIESVSGVSVLAADTADNQSLADLIDDVQTALDTATASLEQVDDTLLGLSEPVLLTAGGTPLIGDIPVPENGVLDRDVRFEVTIGGTIYRGTVTADSTLDNEQENDGQPDPVVALAADVAAAINDAIAGSGANLVVAAHPPLGQAVVDLTTGGSVNTGSPVAGDGVLDRDLAFTLTIDGTEIVGAVRAQATEDNGSADELASDVEAAITQALANAGFDGVQIDVRAENDGTLTFELFTGTDLRIDFSDNPFLRLEYSATGATIDELHFVTPAVIAEFAGNRVGLYAVPVLAQPDDGGAGRLLGRSIVIDAEFDDSAFTELGLLSSPVPADGVLDGSAEFRIVVDDVEYTVTVAPDATNTGVDDLIDDINAALAASLGNDDVQARRVMFSDTVSSDGNRIEFFTAADSGIRSLALPALADDAANSAISQLGFSTTDDYSARIQSGEFFIRDAALSGSLSLDATDIDASAIVGFGGEGGLGLGVEVVDSTGGIFGDVAILLVNPDDTAPAGDETRLSLGTLWDYLGNSDLDLGDVVQADITGGVDIDLDVAPELPIRTPIEPANVAIDLALTDWLNEPPSLADASLANGLSVNVSGLDLSIYDALSNLSFTDVVDALREVLGFLRELQGEGDNGALAQILDQPLPLLNQSPSDLLVVADRFATLVDEVVANPAESLNQLETLLEDLLGLPEELVTLALDFDDGLALRVDLVFETGIEKSLGFDLDIEDLVGLTGADSAARGLLEGVTSLVGVSSTGDLSVGVDGTVRLSFGIALGNGNGSASALGFKDGAVSAGGVLTASGDAQAAADRLVDQDIEFELLVDGEVFLVTVTAGAQTSEPVAVDATTRLGELDDAPQLVPGADIRITLLDGSTLDIDLGAPGSNPTIAELVQAINGASPNLSAEFDEAQQRILIEDRSSAPDTARQSGVFVTQTDVDEFAAVQFSLQVGTGNDPVPVSVAAMSNVTRKEWLAAIDEAIRKAMVDAGQLNPVAAAVVDVAYNGTIRQLTFQGTGAAFGERLTIVNGGVFGVGDLNASAVANLLGLAGTDADGDRNIAGKTLRTDAPADTGGLVADVQQAIRDAMGDQGNPPIVAVSLLPPESGTGVGRLQFTADPGSELVIRSVEQALAPFLYNGEDGTGLFLNAGASGENLEFTAQVGPFGFFVIDGGANLDAFFNILLEDTGAEDGRTFFGQDEFAIDTEYGGSASAELPLFFPTESAPVNADDNTLDIVIPDLLAFLGTERSGGGFDREEGSVVIETPDLTAFPTPTLIGMLSNPEFIVDGLDSILLSIQDALDGEIYGIDLPLIGDGLAPAGQFIADFREDVLAYLSLKLREGGLNPVTLVQETLYNVFGGEDDGDPAGVTVLGFEPDAENNGVLRGSTALTGGMLERNAELNITVGNDDPTRVVVFAEDIEDDSPEALVEAINKSLEGRGLADELTAGFEADGNGGFFVTLTAADPDDTILVETAGAIPLDLFGLSVGALDLLQDAWGLDGIADGVVDINDIVRSGFGLFDEFGQFDFLLGDEYVFGQSLDFDLGLPILNFDLDAGVEVGLDWQLAFGFGVSQEDGFYFVAGDDGIDETPDLIPDAPEELIIAIDVNLLGVLGFSPGQTTAPDAELGLAVTTATAKLPGNGRLSGDVVFALEVDGVLVDGITIRANDTNDNRNASDLVADIETAIDAALAAQGLSTDLVTAQIELDADGDVTGRLQITADIGSTLAVFNSATAMGQLGFLVVEAVDGGRVTEDSPAPGEREYSGLDLRIAVDVMDPGTGSGQDGRLTFSEITASSTELSDVISADASGGALVNLGLVVSFDALGLDSAFLPAIGTDLFVDWEVSFNTLTGNEIGTPDVEFRDITLDLGSFISDFAGPFLEDIGTFLEPLGFLLDRQDGLLYKRLPVISDLAGETVTLKQLAETLDRNNRIGPFLNAIEEIFFLTELVTDAAAEAGGGPILLEFGTISLTNLAALEADGKSLADATPDRSGLNDNASDEFNRRNDSNTQATRDFTKNVTRPSGGSISFEILKPGTIVDLLLGKPDVNLITYDLPPFGFDFDYLQRFPIFPPLFATLRGYFSSTIDLGFGYDTLGLNQFLASENPLDLINGFFISDVDADGVDIPEITLLGGITAGASLDAAVASAGVEGGIDATILFNLNDPDQDTKVRLSELLGNVLLNSFNPLAIFDTTGKVDAFLRAYVEVLFGLWSDEYEIGRVTLASFDIPFDRPPILAQNIGDGVLQLNMGTASENRIHGSLADGSESVAVRFANGSVFVSDGRGGPEQRFSGIEQIKVDAGAGDDTIDLRGLANSGIAVEVRGGTGNDTIYGATGSKNVIFGDEGDDTIFGGNAGDEIDGGEGADTIIAGSGADIIFGGAGADTIFAGAGDDEIDGGAGDDSLDGGAGDDVYRFSGNWGDDEVLEATNVAGGADVWDFGGTSTDIGFSLGGDIGVGAVENAVIEGNLLRITSTQHGLSSGDQLDLSGIRGAFDGDGNPVELAFNAVVSVTPGERDSFTVVLPEVPDSFVYQDGSGIFQLDRTALEAREFRNADETGDEALIQVQTGQRHGLADGDVVRVGNVDPLTGVATLAGQAFVVTVVDARTFNLDGTDFGNPTFDFDNAFIQRQESGTGLVENVAIDAGTGIVTVTSGAHGLVSGDEISLFGTTIDGLPPGEPVPLNNVFAVTVVDDNTFTINVSAAAAELLATNLDSGALDTAPAVWQLNQLRAESVGNTVFTNGYGIEHIAGGRGGDTFDVYQTAAQEVVLDGRGGSDTYRAHAIESRVGLGANANTRLFDTGNLWDTDVALFFGSESADRLLVDNTNITTVLGDDNSVNPRFAYGEPNVVLGFQSGASGTGQLDADAALDSGVLDRSARFLLGIDGARPVLVVVEPDDVGGGTVDDLVAALNEAIAQTTLDGIVAASAGVPDADGKQLITFTAADSEAAITIENVSQGSGIEALEIEARGGDDALVIGSTNSRTAVLVSGGLGDDVIVVGGPADMNTTQVTVDGIRGSVLTGPLVIEGNEGINSLVVSDADDDQANTGTLTDGSLSGLGMQIDIEYADMAAVSVQLGSGGDVFTVENTIDGVTSVLAGDGGDTIDVQTVSGVLNVDGEDGADAITLQTSESGSTTNIAGGGGADDIDVRTMQGDVNVQGGSGDDVVNVGTTAGLELPGVVNLINGRLDISGGDGNDRLIIDDREDGGRSLAAQSPLNDRVAETGRLSGDARFELDLGDGEIVEVVVAADIGRLSAASAVAAGVQADGRLSGDAMFVLTVGNERFDVTVQRDDGNQSLDDLLDDINASLEQVGLDVTRVSAGIDDDTIVLDSLQGEDVRLDVAAGDTAATELGFADDTDAVFDNNNGADLEADINAALADAGAGDRVAAAIDPETGRLSFTLNTGEFLRVILDDADPAKSDLGLASGQLVQPNNVGTLRINAEGRAELIGLGMGVPGDGLPGIVYDSFAAVNISLGSGHDEFNVQGTLNDEAPAVQSLTTIDTGTGDDVINVSSTGPAIEPDRGHLNGVLDAVQGELTLLAGDGHNTLNISDRESLSGDANVVVTSNRIEGLAPAAINYSADSGFAGGINLWAGSGSDTVTIESTLADDVTTFYANDGDDNITLVDVDTAVDDGLLVLEGGLGNDAIDGGSWNASMFVFGDLGEIEYQDRTRAFDQIVGAATILIDIGGADQVFGGSADDFLFGGIAGDTLGGGLGDDVLLGDGGRIRFDDTAVVQIEATDFFIGGGDMLAGGQLNAESQAGGDGNDVIIGGAGFDLLFGTLAEDILIYEYGRVSYENDLATTVIVLGQRPLDLAASELFDLYLKDRFLVSPYLVGDVVAERAPIEIEVVAVSTGATNYSNAFHEPQCQTYRAEVGFELGSAILTPESYAYLEDTARFLSDLGGVVIRIGGHADSSGPEDFNRQLSLERAEAVVRVLIEYGVNPAIVRAAGYGEDRPVADNATEEGRAANRRVEIEVDGGVGCERPDPGTGDGASGVGLLALAGWRSTRAADRRPGGGRIAW